MREHPDLAQPEAGGAVERAPGGVSHVAEPGAQVVGALQVLADLEDWKRGCELLPRHERRAL